ncbi:MAG: hypothetical protein GX591_14430 [Planctomycetes bacterium]|nr:hypothetical protein [Planctomycetota bacterium]
MVRHCVWAATLGLVIGGAAAVADESRTAALTVHDDVLHTIDVRLFGQFLERASFGDHGPEAFVDARTGRLPDRIVAMLKGMEIPIIRFPGGTDVDYIDWRDMIDNVPGRDGPRPVTRSFRPGRDEPFTITNRFGYDEYFALRDELKCQTILVVNLLDGLAKRRPLDEAARLAAGLVAYANAPVGAALPEGMPDWPAVRAANGHPAPFKAEFVQIGNEIFLGTVRDQVAEATGLATPEALAAWYVEVYTAYVRAIRAVDPNVQIIIDAWLGGPISQTVHADPAIKANVAYLACHRYAPGACNQVFRGDGKVDVATVSDEQLWWAWTSMPGAVDAAGQNQAYADSIDAARRQGYLLASTEWNWNGWSWQGLTDSFDAPAASGLGAAAFLHGLMRQGGDIRLATQSMLLGRGWSFASVFADPTGKHPPYYTPQGSATLFCRRHHGPSLLRSELTGVRTHPQPYRFGWGGGVDHEPAELDVLVTADAGRVFIHAINRTFDRDLPLRIDLSALGAVGAAGTHHRLTFGPHAEEGLGVSQGVARISAAPIAAAVRMTVMLPARTVSIIEVPRTKE